MYLFLQMCSNHDISAIEIRKCNFEISKAKRNKL